MIPGAPEPARWTRAEPRRSLPAALLERMVRLALPGRRVLSAEPLGDGWRNANFKLRIEPSPETAVLRIYEHDPSLCAKEAALWRLVSGVAPVPELIFSAPRGGEDLPPFALVRWIEGVTFHELKRGGDRGAIAQAAGAAGATLAALGQFTFPRSGGIGPGPAVTAPLLEGADPLPRFVDLCLASESSRRRVPPDLRGRTHALLWAWAARLAEEDRRACLVHGDFNRRNLLLRQTAGRWRVAAVLDWEFAVAGSPLADVGRFLRYERAAAPLAEPCFSTAFTHAGGRLPHDWRRLARILDLAAICESLSGARLPEAFVPELVELLRAAVEP